MNIGTAAERSGLPSKTIRYYEDIGLIRPERAANGYRDYSMPDVHKLAFLHRARSLGFSIDECRQLLALYEDKTRASADVKSMAQRKIAEIDRKMDELQQLRRTLGHLVGSCQGDDRPDCPILDTLAEGDGLG
jgi:MerR family copper efflux transcriptional regulator